MKVRWTAGSLRLRITPTELAALERGEPVEERLRIPGAPIGSGWNMVLLPGAGQSDIGASESVVLFDISRPDIARLAQPEHEGIYCQQGNFSFFIEKDTKTVRDKADFTASDLL